MTTTINDSDFIVSPDFATGNYQVIIIPKSQFPDPIDYTFTLNSPKSPPNTITYQGSGGGSLIGEDPNGFIAFDVNRTYQDTFVLNADGSISDPSGKFWQICSDKSHICLATTKPTLFRFTN